MHQLQISAFDISENKNKRVKTDFYSISRTDMTDTINSR